MRRAVFIAVAAILASSSLLMAQDETPSLGEIARKYREQKKLREAEVPAPQQPPAVSNASVDIKPAVEINNSSSPALPMLQQNVPVLNSGANADLKPEMKVIETPVVAMASPQARQQHATPGNATVNADLDATRSKLAETPVFRSATPEPDGNADSGSDPKKINVPDLPVFPSASPRPMLRQRAASENVTGNNPTVFRSATPDPARPADGARNSDDQHSADQSFEMDEIYSSIGQNLKTPEGERYSSVFAREFAFKNSRGVRECLGAGARDPGPFDVVVQVSSDGAAQKAMIFPDTGVSSCLRGRLARASFSAPPRPGYWVKVTLTNQ